MSDSKDKRKITYLTNKGVVDEEARRILLSCANDPNDNYDLAQYMAKITKEQENDVDEA